jgi:transcriptional regulator with XRE-family HTH domain
MNKVNEVVKSNGEPTERSARERPYKEYGDRVRTARDRLDLSQKELADKLDVGVTWVSQIEGGTLKATRHRKEQLAAYLGDEDLRDRAAEPRRGEESQAFVTVWRLRADLLDKVATRMNDRTTRRRLTNLQGQLVRAARIHPRLSDLTSSGELPSTLELVDRYDIPEWIRRLALIEVAGMRLDAPAHIRPSVDGDTWRERLEVLDRLAEDLFAEGELETAGTSPSALADRLKAAFRAKIGKSAPNWLALRPTGGGQGAAQALLADPSGDAAVLLGFDPFGWMGLEYLAGRWLLPGADRQWLPDHRDLEEVVGKIRTRAAQESIGGITGVAVGSAFLGPVLGSLVGAAVAGLFTSNDASQTIESARDDAATDESSGSLSDDERLFAATVARAEADTTARIWGGFGRVRGEFEVMKINALYAAYPDWAANGNTAADIPTAKVAAQHLGLVADAFGNMIDDEVKAGGTEDSAKNIQLRRLSDMQKTARAAQDAIGKTAAGS